MKTWQPRLSSNFQISPVIEFLQPMNIAGIDFGSKLAGTTVIAYLENETIEFFASAKNQDADRFILEWTKKFQPDQIFIDAPLSLPGVYINNSRYDNYFYRKADLEVKAMSPMFLGGLTARAIQLKSRLSEQNIEVIEIYPSHLADVLELDRNLYKKQKEHIPIITTILSKSLYHLLSSSPSLLASLFPNLPNWHHVDALLALISGIRYRKNQHLSFGDPQEGQIIV